MISKNSQIVANFEKVSGYLIASGKYAEAKITVKNAFQFDKKTNESLEIVNVLEPMKVIKEPEFKYSTKNVKMGNEFLQMCMQRPIKPHKSATFNEWNAYNNWNKTSDEDKVRFQLEKYGHDDGWVLIDFEIL